MTETWTDITNEGGKTYTDRLKSDYVYKESQGFNNEGLTVTAAQSQASGTETETDNYPGSTAQNCSGKLSGLPIVQDPDADYYQLGLVDGELENNALLVGAFTPTGAHGLTSNGSGDCANPWAGSCCANSAAYWQALDPGENDYNPPLRFPLKPGKSMPFKDTESGPDPDIPGATFSLTLGGTLTARYSPCPSLSVQASPSGPVGSPVALTAQTSGGCPGYTYSWHLKEAPRDAVVGPRDADTQSVTVYWSCDAASELKYWLRGQSPACDGPNNPVLYEVTAKDSFGQDATTVVRIWLKPGPAPVAYKPPATPAPTKKGLRIGYLMYGGAAAGLTALSAYPPVAAIAVPIRLVAGGLALSGVSMAAVAETDPPDEQYTQATQPVILHRVVRLSGRYASASTPVNALVNHLLTSLGLAHALATSLNREHSAAAASAGTWERLQMLAAALYCDELASQLTQYGTIAHAAVEALAAVGLAKPSLAGSNLARYLGDMTPNLMVHTLLGLGATQTQATSISHSIYEAARSAKTGPVVDALDTESLVRQNKLAANGLRAYAAILKVAADRHG